MCSSQLSNRVSDIQFSHFRIFSTGGGSKIPTPMSETSEAVHEEMRKGGKQEKKPILIKRGEQQQESKSVPAGPEL